MGGKTRHPSVSLWNRREFPPVEGGSIACLRAAFQADLARAADERMAATRAVYARFGGGQLVAQPSRLDLESKYLLSGLAFCASCDGALIAQTRDFKKARRHVYGCSFHRKRGQQVCRNGVQIAHAALDEALLGSLGRAFSGDMVDAAVERPLALLRERRDRGASRRPALERELAAADARVWRLTDAVARGRGADALLDAIEVEQVNEA